MQSNPVKLRYFLLLSATAHAFLLWEGRLPLLHRSVAIAPLQATIAAPIPAVGPDVRHEPVAGRPAKEIVAPRPMRAKRGTGNEEVAVAQPAKPDVAPESGAVTGSLSPDKGGHEAPEFTTATAPPAEGISADGLRRYRLALAREARRFKRYPPLARERGWEGTAEVVAIFGDSLPPRVVLEKSSDHAVLDQQAVAMITQAVQAAELPDSLRGRNFRLVIPVRYGLDD